MTRKEACTVCGSAFTRWVDEAVPGLCTPCHEAETDRLYERGQMKMPFLVSSRWLNRSEIVQQVEEAAEEMFKQGWIVGNRALEDMDFSVKVRSTRYQTLGDEVRFAWETTPEPAAPVFLVEPTLTVEAKSGAEQTHAGWSELLRQMGDDVLEKLVDWGDLGIETPEEFADFEDILWTVTMTHPIDLEEESWD